MNQAERHRLARQLRGEVAQALTERQRAEEREGRGPMSVADQRLFGRRLINHHLERYATEALRAGQPPLSADEEAALGQAVHDALFGLGVLQRLLADSSVENINANGAHQVWITRADGTKQPGPPLAESDEELVEIIRTAAARVGLSERRFDVGSPALNLQLADGSRLFAVMAVTAKPCVCVRRHRHPAVTLDELAGLGMVDTPVREFLAAAVRTRKNLIVCGGTGAGKTTLLRALLNEVPACERLVTIEDNFELGLDRHPQLHPDVVAMEAREPNVEGEGEVSLAALVRMGLRMSPDRVIVGEVRGAEVLPMLNAMSQGNDGSMCTIHAHSSAGAFARLAMYAIQSPERLDLTATNLLVANSIHFVVFIAQGNPSPHSSQHGPHGGRCRYVSSIREVVGAEGPLMISNEIFAPGPDRRAVPAAPLRHDTLDELVRAGFDPAVLSGVGGGWGR
jgi:pilus assembly protein CpaF